MKEVSDGVEKRRFTGEFNREVPAPAEPFDRLTADHAATSSKPRTISCFINTDIGGIKQ